MNPRVRLWDLSGIDAMIPSPEPAPRGEVGQQSPAQEVTMRNSQPQDPKKPAPKLHATPVPPAHHAENESEHEERVIDEAVDESFPASDPPAIQSPSGTLAV